jgi:hypothetical protein
MRLIAAVMVLSAASFGVLCPASLCLDDSVPDLAELTALENKANRAPLNDKCFLYAKLVSRMTELANQQLKAGDSEKASVTLKTVQYYADKIHSDLVERSKKLKNAQLLLERTYFRLKDIMYSSSYEDRPNLEATLKELDQVQSELMVQVFKH